MKPIRIAVGALRDLRDGFAFYEAQREGLGEYFAACLRGDMFPYAHDAPAFLP